MCMLKWNSIVTSGAALILTSNTPSVAFYIDLEDTPLGVPLDEP